MYNVDLIVEVAKEVEAGDPIDWKELAIQKEAAYRLIAAGMLEYYQDCPPTERELMLLAVATKLSVENFVLNLRLHKND